MPTNFWSLGPLNGEEALVGLESAGGVELVLVPAAAEKMEENARITKSQSARNPYCQNLLLP